MPAQPVSCPLVRPPNPIPTLDSPILQAQALDTPELRNIGSDQHEVVRERLGGDQYLHSSPEADWSPERQRPSSR
jgi:hypothetical protein